MRARSAAADTRRAIAKPGQHARRTLHLREGSLKLVLVADTHSAPHAASAARIAEQKPDHILHGGDIGDVAVLEQLARIAPVTAVRGNIDAHAPDLPDWVTIDVADGETTRLRILLTHIAVAGVRIRADVARIAHAEAASLVVCGHSHIPFIARDRDLVVFNPGSIGPRRFQLPIVFGVLSIGASGLSMHHVDCETGLRWEPS